MHAELVHQFMRRFRQTDSFHIFDRKGGINRLTAKVGIRDRIGKLNVNDPRIAGLGTVDFFAESLGHAVPQSELRIDAGIGTASRIDRVDVRWPSGSIESLQNVPANERVTITEGKGVTSRTPFTRR